MASADHPPAPAPNQPPSPTGIQTAGETYTAAPIPLPPPAEPRPVDPVRFARQCRVLDAVLIVLVLAFAFLTACFQVRNSDFFRHLATGRLLAAGAYPFGGEPFTWGAADAYWVNHSWLFGLLVYGVYQLPAGGILIVVCKALLVTALAEVLLRVSRRRGQPLWIPAACTGLALLTLSPRLLLQPSVFSYLFLGLTLALLRWPRQARERGAGNTRHPSFWLLPPLFALWVNLDAWFLLGPAVVALYLLGEAAHRYLDPRRSRHGHGRAG